MVNTDNFGIANGILKNDPVIFDNKDGSKKILLTVLASDMTRDANGNRTFQRIPLQGFIPKTYNGIGPYKYLKKGEEVHVEYCVKVTDYNPNEPLILQIDSIKFGKNLKSEEPKYTPKDFTKTEPTQENKPKVQQKQTKTPTYDDSDINDDLDFDM